MSAAEKGVRDLFMEQVVALGRKVTRELRPVQLEPWPDDLRALPNELLRTALFTVGRGKRKFLVDEPLLILGGGVITYRGEELRVDDEDVLYEIMHLARRQPLEEWVEFTPYQVLKALGRPRNQEYYRRLQTCLSRLTGTVLKVSSSRLSDAVGISLIRKFQYESAPNVRLERWRIWIEREMHVLYSGQNYTRLEWKVRLRLTPIAKRLMDYFSTHRTPFPVKAESLRQLCGSETKSATRWRQLVRMALDELKAAGFIRSWCEDAHDRFCVQRE